MDNLGKDIRTVASGVAGVGDSAEVYAIGYTTQMVKHVDAGYDEAIEFARDNDVKIPMVK